MPRQNGSSKPSAPPPKADFMVSHTSHVPSPRRPAGAAASAQLHRYMMVAKGFVAPDGPERAVAQGIR